ncbi:DUF5057 domain-containing protein [Paenibacillus qinlingensis]|uniref:DUF5057 domain-containing protein n=1 Tax=Paenibacillus qinlingensis TaxID=1837343 RepID=UPI0015638034|nr:DUF5057 domain-containing protein [Paenibacillus qinlingensis]
MRTLYKRISFVLIATLLASMFSWFQGSSFTQTAVAATGDSVTVSLQTSNNKFVSVDTNDNSKLKANKTNPWFSELFDVIDQGDGNVALKSRTNNRYISVGSSENNSIQASANTVGTAEKFQQFTNTDGTISFKSLSFNFLNSPSNNNPITPNTSTANAAKFKVTYFDLTKPLKVLEIKDLEKPSSGEANSVISDLSSILGTNTSLQLETMSIKKFVALRDELDGKYDAIYFGNSLFNPTSETGNNHNTRYEENDITNLKATEITEKYINKGLPVIVYSDSTQKRGALYQSYLNPISNRGKLFNLFNPYNTTTPKSNVIFVNQTDLASTTAFLTKTNLLMNANVRPQLNLISAPTDYTNSINRNATYTAGDTLTYTFNVSNVRNLAQRNLVANLYLGTDSVLRFSASNIVQTVPVTALTNNTISFTLPKGYSGLYYWRLELVDQTSTGKLKDTASGVFRYKDQKPTINVLQVLPNSQSTALTSSLLKSTNMNQTYLHSSDYDINLSVTDFSSFNSTIYSTLNSKYDMVIFGFNDSYNGTGDISNTAAEAVKSFIATKQGVMFTHDTVYQGNQTWINYFQSATGQIGPMTNMGLNAPHTSTSTVKVNEGLLTQFPFFISDMTTAVATTHDQYFRLNLDDPTVIPWYNIKGDPRDIEDSWNHYYTYSKGNVTYSGTGHNFVNTTTNSSFPDWEQKLFVNTMYRAFIGSNHKPTLDILSPAAFSDNSKNYISANSDISVSFKPDDLDLDDKTVTSTVTFTYQKANGSTQVDTVLSNLEKPKGETVTRTYSNPLANRGGDLTITVSTVDPSGAKETKSVLVKVITSTGLNPTRTLSNDRVEKNTPVTIQYAVTPIAMDYNTAINVGDLTIKRIHFKEKLPAKLEIINMPAGFSKSGTVATGYTIEGNLPDIPYRQVGTKFIGDNSLFSIQIQPLDNGNYSLTNATLSFKDYSTATEQTILFTNRLLTAFTKLTSLALDGLTIAKDDKTKLIPKYQPDDATFIRDTDYTWSSNAPSIVSVDDTGIVTGNQAGTANITAVSKDGSGLQATATVTVIIPGLNITGPSVVNVNQPIELRSVLVTANENIKTIYWQSSNDTIAMFSEITNTQNNGVLWGKSPGQVVVTLTITTDKGKTYKQTYGVTVLAPVTSLDLEGETRYEVGDSSILHAYYQPGYATNPSFDWHSSDSNVIEILQTSSNTSSNEGLATIKAKSAGNATITVSARDGSNLSDQIEIRVIDPAISINTPVQIKVEDTPVTLQVSTEFIHQVPIKSTWKLDDVNQSIVVFKGDAILTRSITGAKVGTVTGTVTIDTNEGKQYSANFRVTVENPVNSVSIKRQVNGEPDERDNAQSTISVDKGSSVNLTALIQRPDAVHTGFKWFIIKEAGSTGSATLNTDSTQNVTLTGDTKGTIKVRVLVGGKEDIRNVAIIQTLTNIKLPDGPIRLVLNTDKNTSDIWSQTVITPTKWRDELKDRLEWIIADPTIVSLSNGVVTGTKAGTTDVTLRYLDDQQILGTVRVIVQKQFDNRY